MRTASGLDFAAQNTAPAAIVPASSLYSEGTNINSASTSGLYKLSTSETVSGAVTLNGLILTGSNLSLSASGAGALTFNGGGETIVTNNTSSTNDTFSTPVSFGTIEGSVMTDSNASLTLSSNISTANTVNSLTIGGAGSLNLSGLNSYVGATTLDGGTVSISTWNNIGASTSTLVLTAGTLSASQPLTLVNPLSFNNSNVAFSGNTLTFTGSVAYGGTIPRRHQQHPDCFERHDHVHGRH